MSCGFSQLRLRCNLITSSSRIRLLGLQSLGMLPSPRKLRIQVVEASQLAGLAAGWLLLRVFLGKSKALHSTSKDLDTRKPPWSEQQNSAQKKLQGKESYQRLGVSYFETAFMPILRTNMIPRKAYLLYPFVRSLWGYGTTPPGSGKEIRRHSKDGSRTQHYGIPPSEYQQVLNQKKQVGKPAVGMGFVGSSTWVVWWI